MRAGAAALVGTHDFRSFQTATAEWLAEGSAAGRERSTVRTLIALEVVGEAGGDLALEVQGSGFLRHMVRTLAGTLLEVGRGRRDPASLKSLLDARDRRAAGPTAPAHGLTLVRVEYDPLEGTPASGESSGIPGR
jgi:tRNA pseudouridine38-40 synthase